MSADLNRAADHLDKMAAEYYGTDLFRPLPPEFDWALLDRWLSDTFGFRIDRLSGEYYRRALGIGASQLRDLAADEADR